MMAPLEAATTSGVVGGVEGPSPQINGLRFPCMGSILRARSRSQSSTGVFSVPGCKEFPITSGEYPMSRICPLHIQVGSGNITTNFRTRLDLAVLNLHITCPKFPLFPWYHLHRIIGT